MRISAEMHVLYPSFCQTLADFPQRKEWGSYYQSRGPPHAHKADWRVASAPEMIVLLLLHPSGLSRGVPWENSQRTDLLSHPIEFRLFLLSDGTECRQFRRYTVLRRLDYLKRSRKEQGEFLNGERRIRLGFGEENDGVKGIRKRLFAGRHISLLICT